jgi:hypothetical protein
MQRVYHFGARPAVRHIAAARSFGVEPAAPFFAIVKRPKLVATRSAFGKRTYIEFFIRQSMQTRQRFFVHTQTKCVVNLRDFKICPQRFTAPRPVFVHPVGAEPRGELFTQSRQKLRATQSLRRIGPHNRVARVAIMRQHMLKNRVFFEPNSPMIACDMMVFPPACCL